MASSHKPAWPAGWPGYRDQFRLTGFIWKISARFPRREKTKHPGEESWLEIRETKPNMAKQKIITFVPFIALATVIAVLLQLNGMFIIWKIQQAKQDNAIRGSRIHPAFILVTRLKSVIWQNFQPAYRHPGWKNRDFGNWASPPSHMNKR